jgi:hypothetical protein
MNRQIPAHDLQPGMVLTEGRVISQIDTFASIVNASHSAGSVGFDYYALVDVREAGGFLWCDACETLTRWGYRIFDDPESPEWACENIDEHPAIIADYISRTAGEF